MTRHGPIRATTWRKHLKRRAEPRRASKPLRRRIPGLAMTAANYTPDELQQYEYMSAIGDTVAGTQTPEYQEERRAWAAVQRRAAKRYGAKRAKRRPRVVKASELVRVRAYKRHRPRRAA